MVLIKKKKRSIDLGTLKLFQFALQPDLKTVKVRLESPFDFIKL